MKLFTIILNPSPLQCISCTCRCCCKLFQFRDFKLSQEPRQLKFSKNAFKTFINIFLQNHWTTSFKLTWQISSIRGCNFFQMVLLRTKQLEFEIETLRFPDWHEFQHRDGLQTYYIKAISDLQHRIQRFRMRLSKYVCLFRSYTSHSKIFTHVDTSPLLLKGFRF